MTSRMTVVLLAMAVACTPADSPEVGSGQVVSENTIHEDVIYGHKLGVALTFDVYQPSAPNGAGIVFINSAGWVSPRCFFHEAAGGVFRLLTYDEVEEGYRLCREFGPRLFLENGFTVFNVRHGSAPRFAIPDIVSDVRQAIRFIRLHAPDYAVDPERLGVWGGSAGGHLSLMLGLGSEIAAPESAVPGDAPTGRVASVVSYFPVVDLEQWATPDQVERFSAVDFDPAQYAEYSPINFVSSDDPPTLIMHGNQDGLVPMQQGQLIHEALLDAGVATEFVVVDGSGHGFVDEDADLAQRATLDWFQRHLVP